MWSLISYSEFFLKVLLNIQVSWQMQCIRTRDFLNLCGVVWASFLWDLVSVLDSYVTAIHTEAVWQTASVKKMPVGYGCGQACEHSLTSDWQQRAQLPTVAAGPGVYKWASQGSHGRPGSKQHPPAYVGCCPSVPVPISSHDGQCCGSVGHISPSSPACIGRGVIIATATLRQRRKWLGLGWNKVRILTNK